MKVIRNSCPARAAAFLALALITLPAAESAARTGWNHDAGPGAPPMATSGAIRSAPTMDGRQRLALERTIAGPLAGRRDPFEVPPPPNADGGGDDPEGPLPPGVRGLVIGQLSLKGIVREEQTKTMIAVVTNRANLAYFLHNHEEVYNGVVSRITPNAIYFEQKRPESGGRIETREVVMRLGSGQQEAR